MPPPPVQTMETSSELMIAPAEPSRVNVRPPTTKTFPVSAWKTPPPTAGRPVVDLTSFTLTFQSGPVRVAGPDAMDGAASRHGKIGEGDRVGAAAGFPDRPGANHTAAART